MLLVGALVIAVVTAIMAKNMFAGAGAEQAGSGAAGARWSPKVLVARKALPVGTIIDAESLTFQPWPKEMIAERLLYRRAARRRYDQAARHRGSLSDHRRPAGDPRLAGRPAAIAASSPRRLARACVPITVPVNATSGVAGFVFPGDHVDLVLTQEVAGGGDGPPLKVTETIVRNLRVLATDQRTDSKDEDGKTVVKTFANVTFEATPRIAEKIAVAQSIGSLSLSLRSIADNPSELERAIASGEVKVPEGTNPAGEADAARDRQSADRQQHDLLHWRRRVALPAP